MLLVRKASPVIPASSRRRSWHLVLRILIVFVALASLATPLDAAVGGEADPPFDPADWPSHDWRSPGFVGIVDGQMYDPDCWPLQSVGANVPNLLYRESVIENLEWMRKNKVRWIRVFLTGHREDRTLTVDGAEQRLRELTRLVEAYNASVARSEWIYLLLVLTDYYGQGVPGDVYVRDNPHGCEFVVLAAPWFRRGHQRFSFEQECGGGRVTEAPNYEVNFKPWVARMVGAVAGSPAILGWQIGNELKARNNARNGIADAYDWYLEFVRDIVDTIRRVDRNHLIVMGAQYFAELTDIPYRAGTGGIDPDLRDGYLRDLDRMARACGDACWNVWNLTFYDFNTYPVDDAMVLGRGRIASLATEYGFTLGTREEEQTRFGGDRLVALRDGMNRPWEDIFGRWHDTHWSLLETVERLDLVGVAPWGSPNPDPNTNPGSDLDRRRGISLAPEGPVLWQHWHYVGHDLYYESGRAGASNACLDLNSSGRSSAGVVQKRSTPVPALMARPSASPTPPIDLTGVISGISTDDDEPLLILKADRREMQIRMPRTQVVRTFSLGDTVRARGWPLSDNVMLATSLEILRGRR
jgi:hypothetical protein